MALADYKPETRTVAFPGGDFEVRGLGAADLTILFSSFVDDVEAVERILSGQIKGRTLSPQAGVNIAMDFVRQAPNFVSAAIAIAAAPSTAEFDPELVRKAAALPLHAQVAALSAIGSLTFQDVAGLGNILATLLQTAGATLPAEPSSGADRP